MLQVFTGEEKIELDKVQITKNKNSCELKMNKTCKKLQKEKKGNPTDDARENERANTED